MFGASNTYVLSSSSKKFTCTSFSVNVYLGWKYDGVGFYEPQPYHSWTLNSDTYLWEPPIPVPVVEDTLFDWDENAYQADNSTGWVAY